MRIASVRVPLIVAFLAVATPVVHADTWAPPSEEVYTSADGDTRVVVTPREIASRLDYFRDDTEGVERPGQKPGSDRTQARARLERRATGDTWVTAWDVPLANDVAPVNAVVGDGGRFLVTFDHWHAMGFGDDVVVVYDGAGREVRRWSLDAIVGRDVAATMPRSISSLWWRGNPEPGADGTSVRLPVIVPDRAAHEIDDACTHELDEEPEPSFVWFRIDAATGAIAPEDPVAWDAARAEAARTRACLLRFEDD